MRPTGFVSKKDIGRRMTFFKIFVCSLSAASRAPNDKENAPPKMNNAEVQTFGGM